jgi:hypothetical protein
MQDPGAWTKFWWKGVDIAADVTKSLVTALIIAVTAYLTWEKKKRREHKLELEHEEKKRRLAEHLDAEFKSAETQAARRRRIALLAAELKTHASDMRSVEGVYRAQDLRDRFLIWLENTKLMHWQSNGEIARKWRTCMFSESAMEGLDDKSVSKFARDIEKIILPSETSSDFPWD